MRIGMAMYNKALTMHARRSHQVGKLLLAYINQYTSKTGMLLQQWRPACGAATAWS